MSKDKRCFCKRFYSMLIYIAGMCRNVVVVSYELKCCCLKSLVRMYMLMMCRNVVLYVWIVVHLVKFLVKNIDEYVPHRYTEEIVKWRKATKKRSPMNMPRERKRKIKRIERWRGIRRLSMVVNFLFFPNKRNVVRIVILNGWMFFVNKLW